MLPLALRRHKERVGLFLENHLALRVEQCVSLRHRSTEIAVRQDPKITLLTTLEKETPDADTPTASQKWVV